MYAIIETGGKQLKVQEGEAVYIEKLDAKEGDSVSFDSVILVSGDDVKIGAPYVEGAKVEGTVEKHGRQKKITTYTYKRRKDSHRKQGHRQPYTKVMIDSITA